MPKYHKKHTRKEPCRSCGANCGSRHKQGCKSLVSLKKQGRGYKATIEIETLQGLTIRKYKEHLQNFKNGDTSLFKTLADLNANFNKRYEIAGYLANTEKNEG